MTKSLKNNVRNKDTYFDSIVKVPRIETQRFWLENNKHVIFRIKY